jgi:hypothetical protein
MVYASLFSSIMRMTLRVLFLLMLMRVHVKAEAIRPSGFSKLLQGVDGELRLLAYF